MEYCARSAFKLVEIQEKYQIIKPGQIIMDLGSSPGAWLQVACQYMGPTQSGGKVIGIDIKQMTIPKEYCDSRVQVMQADVLKLNKERLKAVLGNHAESGIDTLLSDMCHSMIGNNTADVGLSLQLCQTAAKMAIGGRYLISEEDLEIMSDTAKQSLFAWGNGILKNGGSLVMKVLEGSGTKEFADQLRHYFKKVIYFRPKATRSESRELYIICIGRKAIKHYR
eukprot:TRINITY_DN16601_c0_g2_i3.p2 TRINITY_DN16601_c0_g2~~TRINITY_DN16601_c0_g2_i3.p2  ORF type:complete len:224 (+),score=17.01 TRINITY_DN16601_c0_g2_i3:211-882(+)